MCNLRQKPLNWKSAVEFGLKQVKALGFLALTVLVGFTSCKRDRDQEVKPTVLKPSFPVINPDRIKAAGTLVTDLQGYTDGLNTVNGLWQGNDNYRNARVIECYPYAVNRANQYSWILKGEGFGNIKGDIYIPGAVSHVIFWSDTFIKVLPYSSVDYMGVPRAFLTITTHDKREVTITLAQGIVPAIKGMAKGTLGYEIAKRRVSAGKKVPPLNNEYPYNGYVSHFRDGSYMPDPNYVPRQYDILYWDIDSDGKLDCTEMIRSTVSSFGEGLGQGYEFELLGKDQTGTLRTRKIRFIPLSGKGIPAIADSLSYAKNYYR